MKKLILILVMLACPALGHAQQTAIQATITDVNGNPYSFLTGSASINCPGNQAPLFNGFTVPRTITITGGDGNGHFSMVLYDINLITPSGCSYNFAITWSDGKTSFTAPSIGASGSGTPITGAGPVNLSTAISAYAVPLPGSAVTRISTTGPITGGPITSTGTIGCPTCLATGQTNVYTGGFLQDFTSATMEIPEGAGFTTNVNSTIGLDLTANITHLWTNNADSIVYAVTATDTATNHVLHATTTAGLGMFSSVSSSDLPAVAVQTSQTNVYGAFLQDFTSGTMEIPEAAGFTTNVNSTIGLDTTANITHLWTNNADSLVCAATATDTTTTHAMFATAVAGICNTRAIAAGDLPTAITPSSVSNFLYVDGIHFTTLGAAITALPAAGGTIFDCFPETFAADPFAAVTKPFFIQFCPGTWTTNVPVRLNHNGQTLQGAGPNATIFQASATFTTSSYVIGMGQPFPGIYGTTVREMAISCGAAPVVGCGAITFDGIEETSGMENLNAVNCTSTTGCIRISSDQGSGATQNPRTFNNIRATMFAGTNQSCVGPVVEIATSTSFRIELHNGTETGVVGGCSGGTVFNPAGIQIDAPVDADISIFHAEQVTSVILANSTAIITARDIVGHSSDANVYTSTAAGGNFTLQNIQSNGVTGNTVNDTGDNLTVPTANNENFCARAGVATPFVLCPNSNAGWVMSPPIGAGAGFTEQLLAGFTGSTAAYLIKDNNANTMAEFTSDGRIVMHGNNATAAVTELIDATLLSASRTVHWPDINGNILVTGGINVGGNTTTTVNCALTTDALDCLAAGETSAATSGTLTNGLANQALVSSTTATNSTATPLEIAQGSITNTVATPLAQFEATWNNASLVGQGIVESVTNTSSAAGSLLLNLETGNTTQFSVGKNGAPNIGAVGGTSGTINLLGTTSGTATITGPAVAGTTTNAVTSSNNLSAPALVSTVATGTAPLQITSTTPVANLTLSTAAQVPNLPLNQIISATGAITTIADGNNPLVINCALTSGTTCLTTGETTAATTAGAVEDQVTTLTTSTAIPLQITMGANGPAAANAPAVLNVSAAAAGGLASASINGLVGAPITLLTGAGSAGGATTGTGGTGGAFNLTTGGGGAAGGNTANVGGIGGAVNITTGNGTAGAASAAGAAGGAFNFISGNGGAGGATSGLGAVGGPINLTAGNGGAATVGSTTGAGGNIVLTPGQAGGTGTPGAAGEVRILGGTVPGAVNTNHFLAVTGTWNTTGTPSGSIFENITDTAAASGSSLLTIQQGGTNFLQLAIQSATPATSALDGPNLALGGSLPEITTPGTTPYLNMNTLVKGIINTCAPTSTVALTTTTAVICSWTLPNKALTWFWNCSGTYTITAGTTPALTLQMNAAQAPTNETGQAIVGSLAASGSITQTFQTGAGTSASSGAQTIFADTPTVAITTLANAPWNTSGSIQASATSGTFSISALLSGSASPAGTINVGSGCLIY